MLLPEFHYCAPQSAQEVFALLKQYGSKAKLMAGGTDLINFMKTKAIVPDAVIDLKNLPGLDNIEWDPGKGLDDL